MVELCAGTGWFVEWSPLGIVVELDAVRRTREDEVDPLTAVREPAPLHLPEPEAAVELEGPGEVPDSNTGIHESDLVGHGNVGARYAA
jgi:hypothetical protein